MATPWCRLWADMPNDPKWRTIARVSKQRIGDVIATYVHMLICASNATERGRTQGWSDEDVATALDLDIEQVTAIREAMQSRVLDGDYLRGWEKRQVAREDESAAARAKAWREEQKRLKEAEALAAVNAARTQANAGERKQTTEVEVEVDTEVEVDKKKKTPKVKPPVAASADVQEVFAYWKRVMGHNAAQLDALRSKNIGQRLSDGYTVGQLCQAVDGCKYDPFSQGANDRQTVFDDIELICRDGPKVDKFRKIAERGPPNGRSANQNKTISNLQAYLDAHEN